MLRKARELFSTCDVEGKGFITRGEMQRLTGQLPLSADQLEHVFDSLDVDHNGYLTLHEFTDGFGKLFQ
jgi:Ras and EF-hand domain-containing protein